MRSWRAAASTSRTEQNRARWPRRPAQPPAETRARSCRLLAAGFLFHQQQMQPAAVRAKDLEDEFVYRDLFAALRQSPKAVQHQPADRVVLFVGVMRAEGFVEVRQFGRCLDAPGIAL